MSEQTSYVSEQPSGNDLEAVCCGVAVDSADLKEITLVPWGHVRSASGEFVVDAESAALIQQAFEAQGVDLVIDYDHATLGGAYATPSGKAPAAGWIRRIWAVPGVGIKGLVEWTAQARSEIRAGQFRYLSPVVMIRRSDRKAVELHSAAVTNKPAIPRMDALAASHRSFTTKECVNMDPVTGQGTVVPDAATNTPDPSILIGEIKSLLSIELDSADIIANLTAIRDAVKNSKAADNADGADAADKTGSAVTVANMRKALGLTPSADHATLIEAVNTLKRGATATATMQQQISALQDDLASRDANDLLRPYIACGALNVEDEKEYSIYANMARTAPEDCKTLLDKRKAMLPMSGTTIAPPIGGGTSHDDDTLIANAVKAHDGNYKLAIIAVQKQLIDEECARTGFSRDRVIGALAMSHPKIFAA